MIQIKVNYTLEEVIAYAKEGGKTLLQANSTCRGVNDTSLLTANIVCSDRLRGATDYASTYTALTSDNYLLNVLWLGGRYGVDTTDAHFGLHVGGFETVKDVFSHLPTGVQNELIALDYLNHNPEPLMAKVSRVLDCNKVILDSYQKDIGLAEEMLVNSHHNMKKVPKEVFTKAWLSKEHWGSLLARMPWFKGQLEEGE